MSYARYETCVHPDSGLTLLQVACMEGQLELVEEVAKLEHFDRMVNEATNEDKWSPLLWATHSQNLPLAELLLTHGALVNQGKSDGVTPFHMAASNNDV